jgi:ubiquinone/menaquinone biosynthesis C-methylase UbiE
VFVPEYKYPLSNEWKAARERLAQLETIWDPWAIRNFEGLRVKEGWHCLEVAGGGGSLAEWLCNRTGSSGHVVATDLQTHFLEALNASNLEVWRHDILVDALPERRFDLVHARAVLTFLPRPAEVVTKMARALKPGGWLLLEEPDYVSAMHDPTMDPAAAALSRKGWDALLRQLRTRGYDIGFGRHLYHDLAINGLSELQAEGFVGMQLGGTPSARFWKITFEQLQDQVLEAALLTEAESNDYRTLLESADYRWLQPVMMSAWGRRIAA